MLSFSRHDPCNNTTKMSLRNDNELVLQTFKQALERKKT